MIMNMLLVWLLSSLSLVSLPFVRLLLSLLLSSSRGTCLWDKRNKPVKPNSKQCLQLFRSSSQLFCSETLPLICISMSSKERRSLSGSVHGCSLSGSTHGSSLSGSVALGRTLRRESSIDGKALAEAIKWSGMQPLFAGRFTDGTLMAKLASEHCDTFRKLL